ncbi:hypothetical protein RUND412_008372 [Rhizina undulata]
MAENSQPSPATSIAKARIEELNKIDQDIALLLSSAAHAIKALTTASSTSPSVESQKELFTTHSAKYHSLLASITVRLRRQILLLEQADIPAPALTSSSAGVDGKPGGTGATSSGVGGGIDVGALNARNDVVGREMEAELWRKAREFTEKLEAVYAAGEADGEEDSAMVDING